MTERADFDRHHDKEDYPEKIANMLMKHQSSIPEDSTRVKVNTSFYSMELEIHDKSIAETHCCIKRNVDPVLSKSIFEDVYPGIIRRHCKPLEQIKHKIENNNLIWWLSKMVLRITSIYVDLFKDTFLAITILVMIGGPSSLSEFPTKYTSVVFFCLITTIILPLTVSSFFLARDNPELVFRSIPRAGWKRFVLQLTIVLLSPLNPAVLSHAYESNKEEVKMLSDSVGKEIEVLEKSKEGRRLKGNTQD